MIVWFSAIAVTVAPLIASTPSGSRPSGPLPIFTLSPAKRPTYWRMNRMSSDSGMPTSRIGSECRSTFTPAMWPAASMPTRVTTGLPE